MVPYEKILNACFFNFFEYVKLVKLAIVEIICNVENERCFSTLAFMKFKLWNRFITHLSIVMHMFAQQLYFVKFLVYEMY